MTEDEARKKWCPQARVWDTQAEGLAAPTHNRVEIDFNSWWSPPSASCVASACMAWRTTSSQHGYCGLAGRPRV